VESREGLSIAWVNNTFATVRTFADTYDNPTITEAVSRTIDRFGPDVAHIHHLTCLSTGIVRALAARRVPILFTLHDYWLCCHRGQLLDVHYQSCEGPGPEGCRSCLGSAAAIGRTGFAAAARLRAMDRWVPAAPRRWMREKAGSLATWLGDRDRADAEARARLDHMREVIGAITCFLAPSRHMRDFFLRFGIPPERLVLAQYGFDHRPFEHAVRTGSTRVRLGFLGSLMPSKAPHVLLEAFRRLPSGTASVDLYGADCAYHGDVSYRDRLGPLLNQEHVRLHGAIDHDQVPRVFAGIDLLVVPSIWPENSPLVIHEAFLAGVPVVASDIGGIPELVEDGINGLLFRAGDAAGLAQILGRFIDEPALLGQLRSRIPPVRTIEDDVAFTRSLYVSALGSPKSFGAPRPAAARARLAAVVLNYGTIDDTYLAARSLLLSRRPIDEVIVVDNDEDGRCVERLRDLRGEITYLRAGSNRGFPGGMNLGIHEALAHGAEHVLLVNSDVIVPPDCVGTLEAGLRSRPGAGIAGPVIANRSAPDRIASAGIDYRASTGRMRIRAPERHEGTSPSDVDTVDAVVGCLMLVRRQVFEAVGDLDEDYFFGFEDIDFCLRAKRAGFETVLACGARAYHEGSGSIGARSTRRLYFAARNHLLLGKRASPDTTWAETVWRGSSIVALNVAHAVRFSGGSLASRLGAVARGTRDYVSGRFGPEP
jgi:GT2 family glycosyltransferase/glycosyltransferase involved in cell wall biosynthesis